MGDETLGACKSVDHISAHMSIIRGYCRSTGRNNTCTYFLDIFETICGKNGKNYGSFLTCI